MKKFLFGQCFILAVNATVSRDFFKKHEQVLKERRADLPLRRDEALRSPEKKVAFTAPLPGLYREEGGGGNGLGIPPLFFIGQVH